MMTPFKFQGCGLKGSGFKIFLIFLSWFRHGSIMGDLSRWNNRWIGLTRNFDINYVAIYTVRYRQFDMDSSLRKKYELLNKLLTIFLFFENLKRIYTKTTVFLRFWLPFVSQPVPETTTSNESKKNFPYRLKWTKRPFRLSALIIATECKE